MGRRIGILLKWIVGICSIAVCLAVLLLTAFGWRADRREVRAASEAAPPGGRFVKAADVEIFIQETGPADGPVVLFIHGTGAWSEAWRGPMTELAKIGVRAIALDLPPFGYSGRPDPSRYGKQDQGRRIVGVLDALQIKRAVLVGHSFGGGPTMEAAFLVPDRVRALVLVDAALNIGSDDNEDRRAPLLIRGFLAARPFRDSVVATFLTNPLFTRKLLQGFIDDPERATDGWVRIYQRPLVVRGTTQAIGAWLPALLAPPGTAASERPAFYEALKTPVFVIWGERDTITPLGQGEHLVRITPGAELAVIKGVGHIPQIEDPVRFNDLLLKIIARVSAPS